MTGCQNRDRLRRLPLQKQRKFYDPVATAPGSDTAGILICSRARRHPQGGPKMMLTFSRQANGWSRLISRFLLIAFMAGPAVAQQPAPAKPPAQNAQVDQAPPFDELLATDTYKLYGEVRNVGTLLSNGGAGEIVEPIVKLADPGPQFKSIISFLKKNSEALAQSRLMFASWPARTDVPMAFVAIEFPTKDEADRFAPKLETFLPTVIPPITEPPDNPLPPEPKSSQPAKQPAERAEKPSPRPDPAPTSSPLPSIERPAFVITHAGNLVFISDKSFKFSKLRPKDSQALFRDQNFRAARDQFSSEPIFFFINVALEDKSRPTPRTTISVEEAPPVKARDTDNPRDETPEEAARSRAGKPESSPDPIKIEEKQTAVLIAGPTVAPSPTRS